MWNKIGRMSPIGPLFLVLGLVFIVLQGCDGSSKPSPAPAVDKAPVAEKTSAEAKPAPAEPMDVAVILNDIATTKNLLAWYQTRSTYLDRGTANAEIDAAFAAKEAELLKKAPAKPVSDALELVDFDWKLAGAESAEGQKETFLATWLLRVNKAISLKPDHDVKLVLRGWFDKAHQQYFDEGARYFELTYTIKPPVADWQAGSYQMVAFETYKKVPNIPYRLRTIFAEVVKNEEGKWVSFGRYGAVDSGWHADMGEAAEPASAS
jgi:hypothetical protein